jgi:hypothetical protein
VTATSGAEIVAVGFAALDTDEQEEAYSRITGIRSRRLAGEEAPGPSGATLPAKIAAGPRARSRGKVCRYREDTLREVLAECAIDLDHAPLVVEFERWRRREMERAKAQGREILLPSDSPYRRRWGSWESALLHLGLSPEAVRERLEPGRVRSAVALARFRFIAAG